MSLPDGPRTRFRRRGYDSNNSCRPSNCKAECTPACSSSERCILNVMTECGQCPLSQCVSLSALGITSAANTSSNSNNSGSGQHVGLIAGLTTGLVAAALVVLTVAGFVYRKRRKRQTQESSNKEENVAMPATPLSPPPAAALPMETGWTQSNPYSPVLLGQSSLQIPRLTTSPPTPVTPTSPQSTSIRRSLNIVPGNITGNSNNATSLYRASSVRVGKYDRMRGRRLSDNFDDDNEEGPVQLRRAVSVKKGQNGVGLARSTSLRSARSPEEREAAAAQIMYAKPVMVRINTVTKKEGGVTRKASVRTVISEPKAPHDSLISNPSTSDDRSARRLRQESWNSQAESSHSSIGDGEITVFWDGSRS